MLVKTATPTPRPVCHVLALTGRQYTFWPQGATVEVLFSGARTTSNGYRVPLSEARELYGRLTKAGWKKF